MTAVDVTKIISWLPFNESVTQDLIGNAWSAYGTPTLENGAVHLPSGAYLTANNIIDLNSDKWTFSCRCYCVSRSGENGFFGLGEGPNRRGIEASDDGIFVAAPGGGSWQAKTSTRFFSSLNQWVHLEVDKDGTSLKFFCDGNLVWSTTINGLDDTGNFVLGGNSYGYTNDLYFDEVLFLEGIALHSENFTPPTENDYADWQLAVAGYAPVKISFDVETFLRNAQKGWRVYNPGEAELLATEGATTVEVPYTQSVTGKAFYGGTLSDMFHTPAGLKEIWIRFDFVATNYADSHLYVGHWNSSQNSIVGLGGGALDYSKYNRITFNGTTILNPVFGQRYQCLLHIKSDATNGLVELTIDKDFYSYSGNINGGNDLNNLVILNTSNSVQFSNVVVSETELTLDDGWHRDSFGVETKINAPVLNVRLQGSNVKFPLSTKRKSNSLTIRVGDKNFYNTSVATSSSLAGAARYLLDDKARALSTATT